MREPAAYREMAGLDHSGSKMRKMERSPVFDEPDQVIPVAALHPPFPVSAQNGMHFSCKKISGTISQDIKRSGIENEFGFDFKSCGGIRVDFQLDRDLFIRVNSLLRSLFF